MVYPLWTFGVALGVGIAIFAYQQYTQRTQQSSYSNAPPRNNNFSDYDSWQPKEQPNSERSGVRRQDAKKDGNEQSSSYCEVNKKEVQQTRSEDYKDKKAEQPTSSSQSYENSERNDNQRNETEKNVDMVVEKVESCEICKKSLKNYLRVIACGHKFHAPCVIEWRRKNEVCPVCQVPFC